MASKISNPRDLLVLLLGELLYVERRLAGDVLQQLADAVRDSELKRALEQHLAETKVHVERIESAFLRLEVAPTANLSPPFESAVAQHDALAGSFVSPQLADVFHGQAALHTENWEIAAYATVLAFGDAMDRRDDLVELEKSKRDEEQAATMLEQAFTRLSKDACVR